MRDRAIRFLGCGLFVAALAAGSSPSTAGPDRFRLLGAATDRDADWIALNLDTAVLGTGRSVTVASPPPEFVSRAEYLLAHLIVDGAIAGTSLYVVERVEGVDRLGVLDLARPEAGVSPIPLRTEPRSTLRIVTMDDFLVVAESGYGLRFLELPGHTHGHDGAHLGHHGPIEVGFHPMNEAIRAVAASRRAVYVAVDGAIVVVDARVPSAPATAGRVAISAEVRDLGANGTTAYLMTRDGLGILDLTGRSEPEVHPEVHGDSLVLAGRSLWVAGGTPGVREFRDESTVAALIVIQVGDLFFSPPGAVNVNAGDTVRWEKAGTVFSHNVFSCNPLQGGCAGAQSTETFTSGPVTAVPFVFDHTFTLAGNNPYVCQVHFTTMLGDIIVAAGAPQPPGVPDGAGATVPVTAGKLDAAGTDLNIAFDTTCAGAADHSILYGTAAQLPAAPGGVYGLSGSRCSIGTTSPFTWTASPLVAPGDFVWWVIVADDGSDVEGSWGKDGAGIEREGPGINGSSGQCTHTDKELANTCGQ